MKKFSRSLISLILVAMAMLGACIVFFACSNNVYEETVLGKWDAYDGVKLSFADKETYNDGEVKESDVLPELNCKLGKSYYMIVDFDIQAPYDNDGRDTVTTVVQIQPASIIGATIQDTKTGNVSEETNGELREIKAIYKIPEKANSVRNMRLVIKVNAKDRGLANINLTFYSPSMKAVKTSKIEKSAVMGYTEELEYNKNILVGIKDKTITRIVIPSLNDRYYITRIGNYSFRGCSKLTNIIISEGITSIASYAFLDCMKLNCVTIPKSVEDILSGAFSGCVDLEKIIISNNLNHLGNYVFEKCGELTSIIYDGTKVQWKAIIKDRYWKLNANSNFTVHCNDGDFTKAES